MQETLGTLELKIARLERYLALLEQQYAMSQAYPQHQARLTVQYRRARAELDQLAQLHQELLQPRLAA